eukprot:gene8571-biopygen19652
MRHSSSHCSLCRFFTGGAQDPGVAGVSRKLTKLWKYKKVVDQAGYVWRMLEFSGKLEVLGGGHFLHSHGIAQNRTEPYGFTRKRTETCGNARNRAETCGNVWKRTKSCGNVRKRAGSYGIIRNRGGTSGNRGNARVCITSHSTTTEACGIQ